VTGPTKTLDPQTRTDAGPAGTAITYQRVQQRVQVKTKPGQRYEPTDLLEPQINIKIDIVYLGGETPPRGTRVTRKCARERFGNVCGSARPREKPTKMSIEKWIETRLKIEIGKRGGLALKFWCVSFTGMPDRMVLLPGTRIDFIELKDAGKRPNPRQAYVHRQLARLGFPVRTIRTPEQLADYLASIKTTAK